MVSIEERSRPVAGLFQKGFVLDARSSASNKGMPSIRTVLESIPGHSTAMQDVREGISATVMDDIISALTRPLNADEKSPAPREPIASSRVIFKGNLKEVNQFFYRRGWTDGLPVMPPTEEEVAEMLTGTDLPPNQLVRKMVPRLGKATVEKIAINAVMAGALPTYMPVLIAAVQALPEDTWMYYSAASPGPFWIINGPIRHALNINCGRGVFSPGEMANSGIGRAMGLILKNLGGLRKGIEEMGGMGNPAKNTMVIGENEEESPWEPLHIERGFHKEDSTITLYINGNSFIQTTAYGGDTKGILSGMVDNVRVRMSGACFIISPPRAEALHREGWEKKHVKVFISENATAYFRPEFEQTGLNLQEGKPRRLPFNLGDPFRLMPDPNAITIVVAGGSWPGGGAMVAGRGPSTGKIELPANWDRLVEKYKNITPVYSLY